MDDDKFDTPMLPCANYLQTANPAFYSNISMLEGFCTNWNGDVQSLLPAISYELTTIFLNSTTSTVRHRRRQILSPPVHQQQRQKLALPIQALPTIRQRRRQNPIPVHRYGVEFPEVVFGFGGCGPLYVLRF